MDAKELRLGNMVGVPRKVFGDGLHPRPEVVVCVVVGITKDVIKASYSYAERLLWRGFDFCEIEPIPLTEEHLLEAGFEEYNEEEGEDGITDYYRKNGIIFSRRYGTIVDCVTHAQIQYLHQLQNLYFALTGEELRVEI
jgi:hypothetical protein